MQLAALYFFAGAALVGCATVKPRPAPMSQVHDLSETYGWFYYGSDVQNRLDDGDARSQNFYGCGHEAGRLKLFSTLDTAELTPVGWWDDRVWRRYARPADGRTCQANETLDQSAKTCWRSYGVQFFPSSPVQEGNRLRVAGTSPLLRILPKDGYPSQEHWCRFDGDTALIWVAGVNNRGLGLAWSLIDNELLANILAWNRNVDFPQAVPGADGAGHGKLKAPPAYIQIVQNDNAPAGGISGDHSEIAIKSMAANFELAYRAGIKHLEVVSHSNGVVTAQLAFGVFSQDFAPSRWNADDWVGSPWGGDVPATARARLDSMLSDRRASGAPMIMTVNFYHLQAAASQRWGNSKLDQLGFYSDLLPTAKWVQKTALGISYWGWDWLSPAYYKEAETYVRPQFRFYYNGGDWMTYDYYRYSSVGRRESMPWQTETASYMQHSTNPPVTHYHCPSATVGVCGPGHEQGDSLWYFASPSMPDTGRPAPWEVN